MPFHVKKDVRGEWRWTLSAANGKKIAASGEGYKDKKDCLHAIDLVREAGQKPSWWPVKTRAHCGRACCVELENDARFEATARRCGRARW